MVIPKKIRIGGQDISVVNKERLDNDILGDICLAEGVLQIADTFRNIKQSESSKINTFIHEIVHGILDTMGEYKLSKNERLQENGIYIPLQASLMQALLPFPLSWTCRTTCPFQIHPMLSAIALYHGLQNAGHRQHKQAG